MEYDATRDVEDEDVWTLWDMDGNICLQYITRSEIFSWLSKNMKEGDKFILERK